MSPVAFPWPDPSSSRPDHLYICPRLPRRSLPRNIFSRLPLGTPCACHQQQQTLPANKRGFAGCVRRFPCSRPRNFVANNRRGAGRKFVMSGCDIVRSHLLCIRKGDWSGPRFFCYVFSQAELCAIAHAKHIRASFSLKTAFALLRAENCVCCQLNLEHDAHLLWHGDVRQFTILATVRLFYGCCSFSPTLSAVLLSTGCIASSISCHVTTNKPKFKMRTKQCHKTGHATDRLFDCTY